MGRRRRPPSGSPRIGTIDPAPPEHPRPPIALHTREVPPPARRPHRVSAGSVSGRRGNVVLDANGGEPLFVERFAAICRRAGEREPHSIRGEPPNLVVALDGNAPPLDVVRLGPPSLGFLVVENSYDHGCLTVA